MSVTLRLAHPDDAGGMLAIYGPLIEDTAISFEYEVPSDAAFGDRIASTLQTHPWLVCEAEGVIAGYAYAGGHRNRTAYQWSAEVSVYVHESFRRRDLGSRLYAALFRLLAEQGFFTALAGITLPNAASVAFHERMGFQPVGVYRHVGFKLGAWRDVAWYQRRLQSGRAAPGHPPRPPDRATFEALLIEY